MTLVRNSSSSGRWSSSRHHSAAETNEVVDGPSARPAQQRPSAPAGAEVGGPPAMPFSGPPPPYGPYPPPGYIMYPSSHPTPPRTAGQPYVGAGSGYHGARVPPPPPTRPTQAQPSRSRPAQPPPPSRPAQAPQQRPTQPPRPMPPPIPTTTERGLAAMVNDRRQEPKNAREAPSRGASRASRGHEQRSERSPSSAPHPHNCSGCGNVGLPIVLFEAEPGLTRPGAAKLLPRLHQRVRRRRCAESGGCRREGGEAGSLRR